jgi:outer membrane protein assembly factor BamB
VGTALAQRTSVDRPQAVGSYDEDLIRQPPVLPVRIRPVQALVTAAVLVSAMTVVSIDPASAVPGEQRWVKRYDRNGLSDYGKDVAASPDGSTVFVTGASLSTPGNDDIATIAYAASDGTKKWARRYDGPGSAFDWGAAITVSPDGSTVFVTGTSIDDFITVAYAASNGKRLWVRRYTRAADTVDAAAAVLVSPDSQTVFVTGQSYSSSSTAYVTIAYAVADGTRAWRTVSDGNAQGNAMALSPDGTRVFVTGAIETTGNMDYETIALDASTGATVWEKTFNGEANGDDAGIDVGVGPSGSKVYVTGRSDGPTTRGNFATIAYGAADGSQRWVRRFHTPAEVYSIMALAVAPNGSRIVVTGWGERGGHDQFATVAYGASGAKAWADRYDGPVDNESVAFDVDISPDSRQAIVTGRSWSAKGRSNFATISYGVTHGPRLWVSRYDGPDSISDSASAVAISPTGSRAFVVGDSDSIDRHTDYATVAYSLR